MSPTPATAEIRGPCVESPPRHVQPQSRSTPCAAIAVPGQAQKAGTVRHFTKSTLDRWHIASDDLDSALLVVGELAANATQYGRGELAVLFVLHESALDIEVSDCGTRIEPQTRYIAADALEHGRGMTIVDALTDEWETHPRDSGWQTRARVRLTDRPVPRDKISCSLKTRSPHTRFPCPLIA
ncbi:ATP-binding protein [Streptomyces sioyaensis]|uniref:ATP-binding protein n=1 Tax=Streptomyces sioyaensis TaxID=67364 RepID=A0A4Q1R068_9ACTN|nr:ATP-binding protein [Streptomyces sioyaensis]RXS68335.1 ATP-binding protein [Streptomyces sioyaensis]